MVAESWHRREGGEAGPARALRRLATLASSRWFALLVVGVLHLALLAPSVDRASNTINEIYRPDAEGTLRGAAPYTELDYEYPPLSLPVLLAPAAVTDDRDTYHDAFGWEMLAVDLAIIALLALALRGSPRRRWVALASYTAGILILSLSGLGRLELEHGALPLGRFDLVVAGLVLAAALARERALSFTWSALLSLGTAIKAFPLLLYPLFARGERSWKRVAVGGAVPLALAATLVLALDSQFGSAIGYHSGRDLQIESAAASPFLLANLIDPSAARTEFSSGSYNVVAGGAEAARLITGLIMFAGVAAVAAACWRRRVAPLEAAAATLAVIVAFAPILSPQFILWLLPISAAAFGLGIENALLLAVVIGTRWILNSYNGVWEMSDDFTWSIIARNLLLIAYAGACVARVAGLRRVPAPSPELAASAAPVARAEGAQATAVAAARPAARPENRQPPRKVPSSAR